MPAPFFPVARKEYLTRRDAALSAIMIRILPPQPHLLNPTPVLWDI
jgi:hypothetical protein